MSPCLYCEGVGLVCFPRVSGDEPALLMFVVSKPLFSPRERG